MCDTTTQLLNNMARRAGELANMPVSTLRELLGIGCYSAAEARRTYSDMNRGMLVKCILENEFSLVELDRTDM